MFPSPIQFWPVWKKLQFIISHGYIANIQSINLQSASSDEKNSDKYVRNIRMQNAALKAGLEVRFYSWHPTLFPTYIRLRAAVACRIPSFSDRKSFL